MGLVGMTMGFRAGEADDEVPAEDLMVAIDWVGQDMVKEFLGMVPTGSVMVA